MGRLTSTRSQKQLTFSSSEQLTTCVSRSLRQQSSLYSLFLWPVYLGVSGVRTWVTGRGFYLEGAGPHAEDSPPSSSPCPCPEAARWEPRLDTRVYWPSRLKQMQVIAWGKGGQACQAGSPGLSPPSLSAPSTSHTHCPRSLRRAAPSSGHSAHPAVYGTARQGAAAAAGASRWRAPGALGSLYPLHLARALRARLAPVLPSTLHCHVMLRIGHGKHTLK